MKTFNLRLIKGNISKKLFQHRLLLLSYLISAIVRHLVAIQNESSRIMRIMLWFQFRFKNLWNFIEYSIIFSVMVKKPSECHIMFGNFFRKCYVLYYSSREIRTWQLVKIHLLFSIVQIHQSIFNHLLQPVNSYLFKRKINFLLYLSHNWDHEKWKWHKTSFENSLELEVEGKGYLESSRII